MEAEYKAGDTIEFDDGGPHKRGVVVKLDRSMGRLIYYCKVEGSRYTYPVYPDEIKEKVTHA